MSYFKTEAKVAFWARRKQLFPILELQKERTLRTVIKWRLYVEMRADYMRLVAVGS